MPGLSHHIQRAAPYPFVSSENPFSACRHGVGRPSLWAGYFRSGTGFRLSAGDHRHLVGSRRQARTDFTRARLPPSLAPTPPTRRIAHKTAVFKAGVVAVCKRYHKRGSPASPGLKGHSLILWVLGVYYNKYF